MVGFLIFGVVLQVVGYSAAGVDASAFLFIMVGNSDFHSCGFYFSSNYKSLPIVYFLAYVARTSICEIQDLVDVS